MQNESLEDNRNNGAQAGYRARRARSRGANATFFALRLPPNKDLETAFVVNKVAMAKRRGTVRLNKTLGGRFELDHKTNKQSVNTAVLAASKESPSCDTAESKTTLGLVRLVGQRRATLAAVEPKDKVKTRYLGAAENLRGTSTNRRAINRSIT